jgi:MFS family permease
MPDSHDAYAALRHRDYRCVLSGNVLAGLAFEMQHTAVGWELYQRTHDAAALGFVGLAQFLPVLVLAIPAGQLADRMSRKWLYVSALSIALCATAGLFLLSHYQGPVPLVYLCLVLHGCSRALSAPARGALIPLVVPLKDLQNAITWGVSGWQIAATLGPALGGVLIAWFGGAMTVYLATATFTLLAAFLIASSQPRPAERSPEPVSLRSFLAGARFVWRTDLILAALTLDLFAVLFGGATALLPIFAEEILYVGPIGFGWLRAAPSIGAVLMGFALAHLPPMRRAGRTLLLAVAGFGVAMIGFGLSRDPLLSFALLALTGALDNISIVVRGTLVQLLTPDAMRGRVSAVNSIFIVASNELGAFESGITAKWFGPVPSVVMGGIGTLIVVGAVAWRWPAVRRLGRLKDPSLASEAAAEVEAKIGG